MGHHCCNKQKVKRGLWSPEEDEKLIKYITTHGHGCWSSVPKLAGLQRCGKSCRLRWINYLRPDLKRGSFTAQEERIIIDVHRILGNRWAQIAKHLPGRTDNEVKNFWNSCIKKKLIAQGLDPKTHNLIPGASRPLQGLIGSPNPPQFDLSQSISSCSATTMPFTITPPMKSYDHAMRNIAMDHLNSHNLMPLPQAASASASVPAMHQPAAMSSFQYQDPHALMRFDHDVHSIDFNNGGSSSSLDNTTVASSSTFHQPGYVDHGGSMWTAATVDAMGIPMQAEVEGGQVQNSMCSKMDFSMGGDKAQGMEASYGGAAFDLDLMESALSPCGVFPGGNSMEHLQWDC